MTDDEGRGNSDEDEVMKREAQAGLTEDLNSEGGPGGGVEGPPWIAGGRPEEEPGSARRGGLRGCGGEARGRMGARACRDAVPGLRPGKTGEKSRIQKGAGR